MNGNGRPGAGARNEAAVEWGMGSWAKLNTASIAVCKSDGATQTIWFWGLVCLFSNVLGLGMGNTSSGNSHNPVSVLVTTQN